MTPHDLFALPTIRSEPWWEAHRDLGEFFGDDSLHNRVDARHAASHPDAGPVFETKLELAMDGGEDALQYVTVSVGKRLLGLLIRTGDNVARAITDYHGWEAALDHVRSFVPHDRTAMRHVVEPHEDIPALSANYGCRTVRLRGETRLVREQTCDAAGRPLLDEDAFRRAFHDDVRRAHSWDEGLGDGAAHEDRRRAAAAAIQGAIVDGARSFMADHDMETVPGRLLKVSWVAVVAATDEGTYAIGVSSLSRDRKGLHWLDDVGVARMGGPEIYDRLEADNAVPAPAPSMFEM